MARLEKNSDQPVKVRFYQLRATTPENALVKIATKAISQGLRISVVAGNDEQAKWLDEYLWTVPANGFLPHGRSEEPDVEQQPLVIGVSADDRNEATVVIPLIWEPLLEPEQFDMVVDFVQSSAPAAIVASRKRYKFYRDAGCTMEYWVQELDGRWQLKN
ncbi:MAG: DNA polymerase III subunit chi [Magnetococcales bacterium]|nr:DNA polymerase III subunit chi [Magnetococcales bacterium]